VPGANSLDRGDRRLRQSGIIPFMPDETRAGRFGECEAEFDVRRRSRQDLVEIFRGFDEMGLSKDDVSTFGNLDAHRFQIHTALAC